jgi:hypothetical protein
MTDQSGSNDHINMLSELLFGSEFPQSLFSEDAAGLQRLFELANSHHVILRTFPEIAAQFDQHGNPNSVVVRNAIDEEKARIRHALSSLETICDALLAAGCPVTVIKSLEHYPDLGSDLDLFSNAVPGKVIGIMRQNFGATLAPRSWGDRLANKWNFIVPNLKELIEAHIGRLGQTGEQVALGDSLIAHSCVREIEGHRFRVPDPADRLILSTLQRMYRHYYLRLCDVADTCALLESQQVDFERLRYLADLGGMWKGVSTFLRVVSDYVERFRGRAVWLPAAVQESAQFRGDQVTFQRGFLRIPIMPHSARLYAAQLGSLIANGELRGSMRLSLLPCLATAALVEYRMTGSDKGVW